MKFTSAEAAKLLKKLKTEEQELLNIENRSSSFVAAIQEYIEDVRPRFDYKDVEQKLRDLECRIRKVKHAINVFNTTTKVDGFDMSIDEILVYIPQLNYNREKFERLAGKLPKERVEQKYGSAPSNFIEYRYANYDIQEAQEDLNFTRAEIDRAQVALDRINNTVKMEIDL